MNTVQFALNQELLEAAKRCDLIRVEELLRQGADPLGSFDVNHQNEHILGELFGCFLLMEWILHPEIFRVMRKIISTHYGT